MGATPSLLQRSSIDALVKAEKTLEIEGEDKPAPGAEILVHRPDENGALFERTNADKDGGYEIGGLDERRANGRAARCGDHQRLDLGNDAG